MTEPTRVRPRRRRLLLAVAVPLLLATVVGAAAGGPGWIRVHRGDTLSELAQRYHTTVKALRELNAIGGNNVIYDGQWLRVGVVPAVVRKPAKKPAPVKPVYKRVPVTYVVQPGDGVYRIAKRYKKDPRWIVAHNPLPKNWMIHPDQRLVVDLKTVRVNPAPRPLPHVAKSYVRALIVREAKRAGLDVSLALALAYEESGWQQDVVSSVGAIGVMQVMPRTGAWIAANLVDHPVDLRDVEDNVEAGVRFLALLVRGAGVRDGVAGYYQGLWSVRKKGMYADTKAYVANILALRQRFAR